MEKSKDKERIFLCIDRVIDPYCKGGFYPSQISDTKIHVK